MSKIGDHYPQVPEDNAPGGFYTSRGIPVQAHDITPTSANNIGTASNIIMGVIRDIHFADSFNNMSRLHRENSDIDTFTNSNAVYDDLNRVSENAFRNPGHHLECTVEPLQGMGVSSTPLPNVPICVGLGGASDYSISVPKGISNLSGPENGLGNGYYCIVGFIGGDVRTPVVLAYWPSPLNRHNAPKIGEGYVSKFIYNNFRLKINNEGDLIVDGRKAGNKILSNSETGEVRDAGGGESSGDITVVTTADIKLSAGSPDEGSESDLSAGYGTFKASKSLTLLSSQSTVDVLTKDFNNLVNLQSAHGGARRAAREGDSVELVAGSGNDIFSYINSLRSVLQIAGNILSDSTITSDPGALAAGAVIKAFASQEVPNGAVGKITSGSDYVKIGGASTGDDLLGTSGTDGGDLFGMAKYDAIPSSDDIMACVTTVAEKYATELLSEVAVENLVTPLTVSLKSAQKYLKDLEYPAGVLPPGTARLFGISADNCIGSIMNGSADPSTIFGSDGFSLEDLSTASQALRDQLTSLEEEKQEAEAAGDTSKVAELTAQIEAAQTELDETYDKVKAVAEGAFPSGAGNLFGLNPYISLATTVIPDALSGNYTSALSTLDSATGGKVGELTRGCLTTQIDELISGSE